MDIETAYAILYLEINIVAVVLVGIIRHKTKGLTKMVAQRNFTMSINAEIVFFLSDTLYVMMKCGIIKYSKWAVIMTKSLYFFSTALMCFFWFVYFEYMQDSPFVNSYQRVLKSSFLVWIMGILLVVNLFTGIFFYVDEGNVYQRGKLFILQYIFSYIYVFVTCTRAFLGIFNRSKLSKRRLLICLALFPVFPAGAGILQFIYPELPLACAALSIATLIMYLQWLDHMISVDPLTRLSNRKQLDYSYEQWNSMDEENDLYLLIIDANRFKGINDTYGHIEGDAALLRIADALRISCMNIKKKNDICRYGGDEFVILAWSFDEEGVEQLKESINSNLKILNHEAASPYELTVSIGAARAVRGQKLSELIELADEKLYIEKKKLG